MYVLFIFKLNKNYEVKSYTLNWMYTIFYSVPSRENVKDCKMSKLLKCWNRQNQLKTRTKSLTYSSHS